jgi:hypothetical protein
MKRWNQKIERENNFLHFSASDSVVSERSVCTEPESAVEGAASKVPLMEACPSVDEPSRFISLSWEIEGLAESWDLAAESMSWTHVVVIIGVIGVSVVSGVFADWSCTRQGRGKSVNKRYKRHSHFEKWKLTAKIVKTVKIKIKAVLHKGYQ